MNRGYVTSGAAGLIVFLSLTALFVIFLLICADKNADTQHIDREYDMCLISVTAPCEEDDICRYKASVPCSELDALVKASKGGK